MKKFSNLFCLLFIFAIASAQEMIENPEKPLSKNTGRIVELIEVMRIDDIGGDFYFKYPRNPKIAPDGSLFVTDQEQLLQFDPNGSFVRNYFKKGQGPGEMQTVGNYFFSEEAIIVHDRRLQKILWFDFSGKLIKEFKIHELPTFTRLHLFYDRTYYLIGHRIPSTEGKPSVLDVPNDLYAVTEDGQEIEKLLSLPVESFAISSGGGGGMISIAELSTLPYKEKYLFLSHTQDYLVKIYDVESRKIIRSFKRKYKRVKAPKGRRIGGIIGISGKTYSAPRDFLNDITKLLVFNDLLWVMTSTADKKKGVLIDVYDFDGQYIDNFFLKFPGEIDPVTIGYRPMTLSGDCLFMTVQNEDETISITKCRIKDKR